MSGNPISALEEALEKGDEAGAWHVLTPQLEGWRSDVKAARLLAGTVGIELLARPRRLALAEELLAHRSDDAVVRRLLGAAVESLADQRYLNAAPPSEPFFARLLESLAHHFDEASDDEARFEEGTVLATVARVSGRRADGLCERIHRELLRLHPERWQTHYDYGLFLKTRGRFEEGVRANQRAMELGGAPEPVVWNLGICATGAGQGALALQVWQRHLGVQAELGATGLPEGRFQPVKVRVAQRPLSAREQASDDPGAEESVWVERLSPCHGVLVSAPLADVGVEFGDVLLFDGAPITHHEVDGLQVPVFPHLATLRPGGWHVFHFAGTQRERGELSGLSAALPGGSTVYSHTESVEIVCPECWEKGAASGHRHDTEGAQVTVRGKLCLDPKVPLAESAAALWGLLAQRPHLQLAAPDLARAAGQVERARREEVLFAQLSPAD